MSNYCGGAFKEPRKSSWRDSNSRNKPTPWYERKEPMCYIIPIKNMPTSKSSSLAVSTFQVGGHQPKDMRSEIQKRLDNDPFFGRNGHYNSATSSGEATATQSPPAYLEAANILNSCIDFVVFKAELSAHSLKLNPIKILSRVGRVTGLIGVGFSIYEAVTDPTWNNRAQAATGLGILGTGALITTGVLTAPAWGTALIAGTVVLIVWEGGEALYEITQKGQ